ncbi:C4-dicarboxylate ABC transporter permease [Pseudooceanicola nanhaiensis]|uniref:TRAP transporter large permease protein n=1 Tax=Pseudooceanicola nanhaiensis TaxID=375761 RepID=A0A917TAH2_9RHOB|nr:TRAP transporter large permease subunit [Pseudooceanicola nanhaiensis]GGM16084.1 C4-dicarboxylate ABC transporter permease [Pseudooceanicola nanhaiensis]
MIFLAGLAILVGAIVVGIPIGFALGLSGILSLMLVVNWTVIQALMAQVVHEAAANFVILTIPMFILMAEFLSAGGIARDLMIAWNKAMRGLRGGLAVAAVVTGVILAATSGSSTASVASITRAAFPTMRAFGYNPGFAIGLISITGTLAILIPPSIALVVFGLMTSEPIGDLFIAGLLPGLLTAGGYILTVALVARFRPDYIPAVKSVTEIKELSDKVGGPVWPIVLLVVLVLGGLYGGVATPSEIGAIGALGAGVIALALGRMTWFYFVQSVGNALRSSAMIITIIFSASLFGYFITFSHVTDSILDWIAEAGLSPYAVLTLLILIYLVLGMVMDQFAILVLTAPITHAIVTGLGFDGVWFGIIMVKTAEIGLVTPPLGLNVFIGSSTGGVPPREAFRGVVPFIVAELVILAILIVFPGVVTWLPTVM